MRRYGWLAVALCSTCGNAAAQERPHLPDSEEARLGSASGIAGDDEDDVYLVVRGAMAGSSDAWEGFQPPRFSGSVGVELGAHASRYALFDFTSEARLHSPRSDGDGSWAMSGHHLVYGFAELTKTHALHLDGELGGRLDHSFDGERGRRGRDVGPAAFHDLRVSPTLWLDAEPHHIGRAVRSSGEHPGLALGYQLRNTRYYGARLPDGRYAVGRSAHRLSLAGGYLFHEDHARAKIRFAQINWTFAERAPTADRSYDTHILDLEVGKIRLRWGDRKSWDDEPDNALRLGLDVHAGWSLAWWGEEPTRSHTPHMSIALHAERASIGHGALAIAHRPAITPGGEHLVGMTSFELSGRLIPEGSHIGVAIAGSAARIDALAEDPDDRWHLRLDGEVFARLWALELGVDGSLGRGPANGSMGWQPFAEPPQPFAAVGAFVRMQGEP